LRNKAVKKEYKKPVLASAPVMLGVFGDYGTIIPEGGGGGRKYHSESVDGGTNLGGWWAGWW
jgi:hypothetical protein